MAGIGKDAVTVDVVAVALELTGASPVPDAKTVPWASPAHDVRRDVQQAMGEAEQTATDVFGQVLTYDKAHASQCALGHENPPGFRFCMTCGLPADAPPPPGLTVEERPRPATALTDEERSERDKQHAEAVSLNMRADELVPDITQQEDPSEVKLRIHFIEDGFTWGGKVWQVGEEIEIGSDHPRWESAVGWISLTKVEQVNRYGRVFFEQGPWPYHQMPPGTEIPLPDANPRRVFEGRRGAVAPARPGEGNTLVPW